MKRYIKTPLKYALPLLFIGSIVLVSISGCTSPATTSPSPSASSAPTATPTAVTTAQATKSVAKATATPQPTATPTPTPTNPSSLLVEQPASASGPDLSAQINANMSGSGLTFSRVTIDGHDTYAAHDSSIKTDSYAFPCNSYSEAYSLQAAYVTKFKAVGFNSTVTQDPWGPNSILTDLKRGSSEVVISAGTTTNTLPSVIGIGPEVDIYISS
jgi:hypothetical protein